MKRLPIILLTTVLFAGIALADSCRKSDIPQFDLASRSIDCNNATPLAAGVYSIGSGEAYFFSWTGTGTGLELNTCSELTDFDTDLRIFDDCSDPAQNFYRDGLGSCGWATYLTCEDYTFVSGQSYLIVISGFNTSEYGLFELIVGEPCPAPPAPPVNDNLADALEILVDGDCLSGSTLLASNDNLPPLYQHACYSGYYSSTSTGSAVDVWYWFESTGGCYTVSLCGSGYDTVLALYDGNGTPIATDDDECGLQSEITSYAAGCWLPAGPILVAVDGYGSSKGDFTLCVSSCTPSDTQDMPVAFELGKAFPNPFNPSTTINFVMGQTARANLTVYNMAGQAVATLVNGVVSAGAQSVVFDASELTSGVYFYTLNVAGRSMTEKMVLVK